MSDLTPFSGKVRNVRFVNKENGFTICEVDDAKLGSITIKGECPPLSRGIAVAGLGIESKDPKWGIQIQVKEIKISDPSSRDGIEIYLTDQVDGIGPVMAKTLVRAFGEKTLEIIRNHPERVREVPGIGPKRAQAISEAARALVEVEKVMTFLLKYGITGGVAMKLFREYGTKTLDRVQQDPWITADHIDGIGFLTADRMAAALGMGGTHPGRTRAGLIYSLKQAESEGHTGLNKLDVLVETAKLLELQASDPAISRRLEELILAKEVMNTNIRARSTGQEGPFIQRIITGRKEARLGDRLRELVDSADLPWSLKEMRVTLASALTRLPYKLSEDQEAALSRMVNSPISVLTGGPGTGKTTLLGLFLSTVKELYPRMPVALCAPTGKAAQRMKESVGGIYEAVTTHRLLGAGQGTGGKTSYNKDNPLPHRLIVADESSMYDIHLMYALADAIDDGACLIIVGDIDQLPSIGPGSVLGDLIASGIFPVSRLTAIHRQAALSKIITNAHAINTGDASRIETGADFEIIRTKESEEAQESCLATYSRLMAQGVKPEDVMVLTSGHKAATGTIEVNEALRARFNPAPQKTMKFGKTIFGVGDRVIVTKNNYKLDVRNGQLGMVTDIDYDNNILVAEIEGVRVDFPKSTLMDLRHGYCITIHKSQGSQAPYVIMLVDKAHYMLLERTLVYTGITRASKHCIVISKENSLEHAVKNKRARDRRTALFSHLTAAGHVPGIARAAA